MRMHTLSLAALLTLVVGCTLGTPIAPPGDSSGTTAGEGEGEGATTGGGEGEGEGGTAANTACAVLQTKCASCHAAGAIAPDLSQSAIQAATLVGQHSATFPSETYIVAGDATNSFLFKKIAGTQPAGEGQQMPSGAPALSQSEQDLVSAWINSGAPGSDCSGVKAPDPIQEAAPDGFNYVSGSPGGTCTSSQQYVGGDDGGGRMYPGQDCIACHQQQGGGEAPIDALMGTVFLGSHDVDSCRGLAATNYKAVIDVLTPTGSLLFSMDVDSAGNFRSRGNTVSGQYRAAVRLVDPTTNQTIATNTMQTAQSNGSCNSCHTAAANGPTANDIPLGRITIAP